MAREWLQYVSGGMDEMFAKWSTTAGEGYREGTGWKAQVEEIQTTETDGQALLRDHPDGRLRHAGDSLRLGLCAARRRGARPRSLRLRTTTKNCGRVNTKPRSGNRPPSITAIAGGAFQRRFANGLVVVNPTTSNVTVNFGGTYSGSGLTNATGATLGPTAP